MRNFATCHPERLVVARGLCSACYSRDWLSRQPPGYRTAHQGNRTPPTTEQQRRHYQAWRDRDPERYKRVRQNAQERKTPEARAKAAEAARRWYAENLDRVRDRDRRRRYGVSLAQLTEMLQRQDQKCGICRIDLPVGNFRFAQVDHDHQTGRVRGILCFRCNRNLGWFEALGPAAVAYLNSADLL